MPAHGLDKPLSNKALEDFNAARTREKFESIFGALFRRQTDLLSYDLVRQNMRPIESARRILGEVPLEKIVGSVGRYTDFSRSFLPRLESDKQRWARVRQGAESLIGLPPIEVYQVGDVYFVLDGHHRVSVARDMGLDHIEAYIIPVQTRVPLSPGDSPDDLIIKSEYTDFLVQTQIDELRPGAKLQVTAAGQYQKLLEHVAVHRYFLGEQRGGEIDEAEALLSWYDSVYLPVAELVENRGLLREFPDRTVTDLYLWIMEYRLQLHGGSAGWEVAPEMAASDLAARFSPRRRFARMAGRLSKWIVPQPFDPGPPPGAWRSQHQTPRRQDHLFDDLLVPLQPGNHTPVVDMAIEIARREKARLTGVWIQPKQAGRTAPEKAAATQEFLDRCAQAGVKARILDDRGDTSGVLVQHSPWVDLALFPVGEPMPQKYFQRLQSGTRLLIRRSHSLLLAVPNTPLRLNSALVAYGTGQKAEEAFLVATYLACQWEIPLTVLTVTDPAAQADKGSSPAERARAYLAGANFPVTVIEESGHLARHVLLSAEEQRADLIIMGGYETGPLHESIFGSALDFVLRSTRRPVLICR
jgi:nucleotide-binding universal stress UspA family protein